MQKLVSLFLLFIGISPTNAQSDFDTIYEQFLVDYKKEYNVDYKNIDKEVISNLNRLLSEKELTALTSDDRIISLINIYNFLVIEQISQAYPITSVASVSDFFTKKIYSGKSLDDLEKEICRSDAYYHFLLNCGAKGCPPLQYVTKNNADSLILSALSKSHILDAKKQKRQLSLSKIFYWNKEDFGKDAALKLRLSELLETKSLGDYEIEYLDYDWSLNDVTGNDILLFYPTKLYSKGGGEIKIFNNYYTQTENGLRSNFFSSFIQVLIGTNKRFNFGLDVKLRSVDQGQQGLFSALGFKNQPYYDNEGVRSFSRSGITGIGPRIRYEPFKDKTNINFLHAIYFVPQSEAEGNELYGYSDFGHIQIFNNMFFEKELSLKRRIFFDFGAHLENIRLGVQRNFNHFMQLQFPVTAIYSYYPSPKITYYGLANVALKPVFNYAPNKNTRIDISGYVQIGGGIKYYLTDFIELEGSYTYFYDNSPGRQAHTFNLGIRLFKF